tara:strand:- start:719 stop:1063 length:345 start_codon:yes stop_codon:yes gene_type:complete
MTAHRSVSERIAETQAQLTALVAKANKEQINASPEIQALDEEIKTVQVSMLKFNRWASEGAEKIENFKARVVEWESRLAEASIKRREANEKIDLLRQERKTLSDTLASEIGMEG